MISRAGRVPTGVDRVELAYLRNLTGRPEPLFAIARTTLGYVLLSDDGIAAITQRIASKQPWGTADRWSKLARRKSVSVRQAESDLRRFAMGTCRPRGLPTLLARHLPAGSAYLNVGHSNLTDRMFQAIKNGMGGQIAVLIHDTIPLDEPQYQRFGTPDRFGAMLRRVQAHADLVIYNSHHSRARAEFHLAKTGSISDCLVSHLGVDVPSPDSTQVPSSLVVDAPYFVTLGTIEPRKGHDLLLDVWDDLAKETPVPGLIICGSRGWENKLVFDRLDRLPPTGPIREVSGLSDAAIAALMVKSCGVLCPSRAEGFGLPPMEAAALGVPVICNDLPVYREILGDIPVYVSETDRYQWGSSIKRLAKRGKGGISAISEHDFVPPTWQDHFNIVLRST